MTMSYSYIYILSPVRLVCYNSKFSIQNSTSLPFFFPKLTHISLLRHFYYQASFVQFTIKELKTLIESTSADSRLGVKRKTKKEKATKDPNKPKRPASAFFIFMESFQVEFKENHPRTANQSFAAISKAGGEKWKMMSQAEKASYINKAAQRKKDYEKKMQIYKRKHAGSNDEGSDKSKSEVYDAIGSKEDEDDA